MASYPSSIVSLATHNAGDVIQPSDVNTPNSEIVAIETGLLNGFQHNLIPLSDDTYSLGSSAKRWLKGWFQDIDLDGTLTMGTALPVASGGTGLASGTSGGILGFTGSTTLASSVALTASDLVQGGGAGATPTSWGTQAANTFIAGPTSGSAAVVTQRTLNPLDMESVFVSVTTQFDKTNTTLADVTGLSFTLVAGKTYHLRAHLRLSYDATGGWKIGTGGTATATTFAYDLFPYTGSGNSYYDAGTSLGTMSNRGTPGGTAAHVTIEMYLVVNAGGTFTIQFAQNGASGTSSVLVGSWLQAM